MNRGIRKELVAGVLAAQEGARVGVRDGGALTHHIAQLAGGHKAALALALGCVKEGAATWAKQLVS